MRINHLYKHGFAGDRKIKRNRFYRVWESIKQRCLNENTSDYKNYGGRGIRVCEKWMQFENFYLDMFEDYEKHKKQFGEKETFIDRIDNGKGYCQENCHWVQRIENANNKRNNRKYIFKGKLLTLPQWARKLNINQNTLNSRIYLYKWPLEKALTF